MIRIVALAAFYNRRDKTLNLLRCLSAQVGLGNAFQLEVLLLDDASTDGTSQLIREQYPDARVIAGDGTYFWAKSMSVLQRLVNTEEFDYQLWLNDDVDLDADAIVRLLRRAESRENAILVGSFTDPVSGGTTYSGGNLKIKFMPTSLRAVDPHEHDLRRVDAFQANCVLLPQHVVTKIGDIDGSFMHAYADNDYGLRARAIGVPAFLLEGYVGTCVRNPRAGTYLDSSLPVRRRMALVFDRKALPPSDHVRFIRKHAPPGLGWPLVILSYVAATIRAVKR